MLMEILSENVKDKKMAGTLAGVELNAENVEKAVLQFYQSSATQVSRYSDFYVT